MIAETSTPSPTQPVHRLAMLLRILVALVSVLVISGSVYVLGIFILEPGRGEELTIGLAPPLYYSSFDPADRIYPEETYANVLGVAHNSGDTIDTTIEATVSGADVIEIDVIELDGELYSAHNPPLPFLGRRWFRGPSLARVWTVAYQADAIKLDLKETSPSFVRLVVRFVQRYGSIKPIIVASRDIGVLRAIGEQAPETIRLLSVPNQASLDALHGDPELQALIDGITVRHSLLDAETVGWLNEAELLTFAWTVNSLPRANELIGWGVDGITSDNLAILNLLGGQERGENPEPLGTPEVPTTEPE